MSKKRVEYSDTFKAEAIAKVKENNGNISQTAKELGIPMNTLANWYRKAERGVLAGTQNYNSELIAALDEIKDLKKQLIPILKNNTQVAPLPLSDRPN